MLVYVDDFFRGSNGVDGNVVVTTVPEDDKSSVALAQKQVEFEVAVGHRDDRVDGVGIAAADQVAEFLVDDVDRFTVVVFRGKLLQLLGNHVPDAAEFLVAKGVRALPLENHVSALEHRSLRNQDNGIAVGVLLAVRYE